MVVFYGDLDEGFYWCSYFDVGEYGFGCIIMLFEFGCDCLGEICYMDVVLADFGGELWMIVNVICIYEEDVGVFWKYYDMVIEILEVCCVCRFVIFNVVTFGNYDYGFYWLLHFDGSIEFEVRMIGIVFTRGVWSGEFLCYVTWFVPDFAALYY